MYRCINVIYIEAIFKSTKMKILIITLTLLMFSCQEKNSKEKEPVEIGSQTVQEKKQASNEIIFRDAQGNLLTDVQKDSLVASVEGLMALRRFDENSNTEYILFKDYEDLRGFVSDIEIENLIEENRLRSSGGQGAVINKRMNDQWKDQPLPTTNFTMIDGSSLSFDDFKGKLLVINFWYINCGPCIIEMPYLNKVVEKYKYEDVQFLALTFDSVLDVNQFLEDTDFDYQLGSASKDLIFDFTPIFPTHMVVDKNGIIKDIALGAPRDTKMIFNKLVNLIEKNKK